MTVKREASLPCRHTIDAKSVDRLIRLLDNLPSKAPDLIEESGLPADKDTYDVLFSAAIESIRGTHSASTAEKSEFATAVLDYMKAKRHIRKWEFVGSGGRQDYRVDLNDGRVVAIEAKGCPDGNNMNIWERPAWADEFVVWSQCPNSLAKHPGLGTWSGVTIRLLPKSIVDPVRVDSMVFWDGRCGSDLRRCPKAYGVEGLRSKATEIPGQRDGSGSHRDWLPPPCIYMFPRTVPNAPGNPHPPHHTWRTHGFADALLTAFNVPDEEKDDYVHNINAEVELRRDGRYLRVALDVARPGRDRVVVQSAWKRLKRE